MQAPAASRAEFLAERPDRAVYAQGRYAGEAPHVAQPDAEPGLADRAR
jgi:hypothetical protein